VPSGSFKTGPLQDAQRIEPGVGGTRWAAGPGAAISRSSAETWPGVGRLFVMSALYDGPSLRGSLLLEVRDDVLAVGVQRCLLGVVHQIDAEVIDAEVVEFDEPVDVMLDRTEDAEAINDLIRDEVR
jgi:hypothetical protein